MNISTAIQRLESVKLQLQNTRPLFIDKLLEWIDLAKSTARTLLLTQTPEGIDHAEWTAQVEYTVGLIGAELMGGEASGILLFLSRQETSLEGFADIVGRVTTSEITLGDIEAYVEAGLEGDPLGKPDIAPEDRLRPAIETAFLIRKAIAAGKSQRDEQIADFINKRNSDAITQYYPAIEQAWREVFSVVAHEALQAYVSNIARRF